MWITLIVIAILVAAGVVFVAMQPGECRVARSANCPLPAAPLFAQVNDFRNWDNWSPWAKLDPAVKNTYTGAPAGAGAMFAWAGNKKVGEGRMTLLESRPNESIKIKLEFIKPFAATNAVEFRFEPKGDQTLVTWSMTARKNFMMKAFHLFMNMDRMIGKEFERGLAQLQVAATSAREGASVGA